jgi:malate dehydrogenase (oxaloacetate-decarboxylating)
MEDLASFQVPYARSATEKVGGLSLVDTIHVSRATVLIGCSAVSGAFNEQIVKQMMINNPRPIIFPLSNPNEQSEADPKNLNAWTNGKGHIATGSPFGPEVAQCNNAYAFPGIGLGVIAAKATCLNDNMLWAATKTLSEAAEPSLDAALLPPLEDVKKISFKIAISIVESARKEGVSQLPDSITAREAVQKILWEPYYRPIRPKS